MRIIRITSVYLILFIKRKFGKSIALGMISRATFPKAWRSNIHRLPKPIPFSMVTVLNSIQVI